MAVVPQTIYARDGDAHLAYQVVADDGPNLLFVPTATFPIDLLWDEPIVARQLRRRRSAASSTTASLVRAATSSFTSSSSLS